MNEIIVTNRLLCTNNFISQIELIASMRPFGILLREKDLSKVAYQSLFLQIKPICQREGIQLFTHTYFFPDSSGLHLPFYSYEFHNMKNFPTSFSVHSVEDAQKSESIGANFIIYGHVFETNCKKNVPPRGLNLLERVCSSVSIPVFAIGGITYQNAPSCISAGATGICRMSYWMTR